MANVSMFLLYGLGGRTWSAGIADQLGPKVRALSGVTCPRTFQWYDWPSIVAAIKATDANSKIAVAGHSLGANVIPNIANEAGRTIDLAVGYDPSIWYPVPVVPANVKSLIHFHGSNWFNPIGHAYYSVADPSRTKLTVYNTNDLHTDIDDDNGLHGITVKAVKALLAA